MPLEALRLMNFQRHERLVVQFDPKVTTIVGASDRGKSSIIRALQWIFFNDAPSDMLRHGAPFVEVGLKVDGHMLKRRKGKKNTYTLDGKEFAAIGRAVPEEVAKLLSLGELNVQGQHDRPFWFGLGRGDVSRQLNAIVDLGVIDDMLAACARKVMQIKAELQVHRDAIAEQKPVVEELAWLPPADMQLEQVEKLGIDYDGASRRVDLLKEQLANLEAVQVKMSDNKELAALCFIEAAAKHLHTCQRKRERLLVRLGGYYDALAELELASDTFDKEQKHYETHVRGHTCPLCKGKGKL